MCTLRNFPSNINHCIEWSREKFNDVFFVCPSDLNKYLQDPVGFMSQVPENNKVNTLNRIIEFALFKQDASFKNCVRMAKDLFNSFYNYNIKDITTAYPPDAKDKQGATFWSGPKRFPTAAEFDAMRASPILPAAMPHKETLTNRMPRTHELPHLLQIEAIHLR